MSMNVRIHELRDCLRLTMKEFGDMISLSQGNVSLIESGKVNITERNIKLICSTWNVNESWLRTGEGEMFLPGNSSVIDTLVKDFSFPEICAKLLYAFDQLAPDQQEAVMVYFRSFVSSMAQDDACRVAAAIAAPSEQDTCRKALAQRLSQELSPASQDGSTETA